ncbi:hypothetical protein EFK50_11465 [Nocardioides marmoriginsengisoli]|uniref:DUF4386 domain-containing protein n=1 Tax=Nocardioides marmoriginsengisoli TaxID=661483 RepID=A0A3N0CG10_9ACTN|nr:hypothetical protein [Nocardioides marmoriginsengisoli]RNL62387.1 hypothetical protein EFK50_11465 [Nocardioides marmoriginsengisoli]
MTITTPRDDTASIATPASLGKGWAIAGTTAGLASIVSIVGSAMSGAAYDKSVAGDAVGITEKLSEQTASILLMHTGAMFSAVLLLVFAPGLRRYLQARVPVSSLLPDVAAGGLLLVVVAQLMGTALTTEFAFGLADTDQVVPETAVFFGHWIGTVPWLWVGAGVAALALGIAGRRHGAVPGWLVWTSLVLGGLTTLFGVSPLQYMAGMTGPIWLTAAALGLLKRA